MGPAGNKGRRNEMLNQMTRNELEAAAGKYDQDINEGGEGHNPYRNEIDNRERAAAAAKPVTAGERRDEIVHRLSIIDTARYREMSATAADEITALKAELAQVEAQLQQDKLEQIIAAGWTADVTQARRVDWTQRLRNKQYATHAELAAAQEAQGWYLTDLKRAVEAHKAHGNIPEDV